MRTRPSFARFALIVAFALSPWLSLGAQQQQTFLVPVEMKDQMLSGSIAVAQHGDEGVIGMYGKGTEAGLKIESVMPGGPAASAGILPGDVILSVDGNSIKGVDTAEALKPIAHKKESETLNLMFNRNGETKNAIVTVR